MSISENNKENNPTHFDYDAIVIGSGPGGEGAAMSLAKQGMHVAVVERHSDVGGGCTHWGTIPSKALHHCVSRLAEFNKNPLFADSNQLNRLKFSQILEQARSVVQRQTQMRRGFYERNSIAIIRGEASFIDCNSLNIKSKDGSNSQLTAKQILLAVGSRPYRPDDVDFSHPNIYDSDTILGLDHEPKSVTIYGAGVIGCEYTSIFRGLDVKVDLVNTRDRLLSFLDAEISDALSYHLRNNGAVVHDSEEYEKIISDDHGVEIHLKSGKKMRTDILLYANGRTGNTDALNLNAVGLKTNSRGQLHVNKQYQTDVANIYAVGDVIGFPSLASAAYDQGRIAADAMVSGEATAKLIQDIPTGIFTIPQISSVGRTEQELTDARIPYEVGRAPFKNLARAQMASQGVGLLKLLFHRETKAILGIHCFGERVTEIVHIGQAIMEQEGEANTIEYFVRTTFNYPTMAEAYRVAALNGLNRLF